MASRREAPIVAKESVTEYLACQDGNGWGACLPDLPGCVAVGRFGEEVEMLIAQAVPPHLASLNEQGEPVPVRTAAGSMKLRVTRT